MTLPTNKEIIIGILNEWELDDKLPPMETVDTLATIIENNLLINTRLDQPTLRDQFAMSAPVEHVNDIVKRFELKGNSITVYQARYFYADKMLTQRKENNDGK